MRVHADWLLTPARVAVHVPTATAALADLHLGYDQARRRGGDAVPLASLEDRLAPLARVIAGHDVRRLVIAGDLFEEAYCPDIAEELVDWLKRARVELAGLVPGNHDRGLAGRMPLFPEGYRLDDWLVVHGDRKASRGRLVLGHWHPCVRVRSRRSAACYLTRADRLVLPAFSDDAAGVNVLRDSRWRGYRCHAIAGDEVLDLGPVARLRALSRS